MTPPAAVPPVSERLEFLDTACLSVLSCTAVSDSDAMDSPPGSSVHRLLQARILGWIAIPFSRGSSRPKDLGLLHFRQIRYHLSHLGSPHCYYHLSFFKTEWGCPGVTCTSFSANDLCLSFLYFSLKLFSFYYWFEDAICIAWMWCAGHYIYGKYLLPMCHFVKIFMMSFIFIKSVSYLNEFLISF